jgi:hypothetical protein
MPVPLSRAARSTSAPDTPAGAAQRLADPAVLSPSAPLQDAEQSVRTPRDTLAINPTKQILYLCVLH